MSIQWKREVEKRKDEIISALQQLLQIPSVMKEQEVPDAPFGNEVKEALNYMLRLGEEDGYLTKNVDHVAGHIEIGQGEKLIGVLGHVDVVPAGDGWSYDPFSGTVDNGRIYGRGAIDDKGPTIAAYFGMKIVEELGLPFHSRVRMIIGTDEESDWRCMDRYFQTEEMPDEGFAPDADFPVIHAEKGIMDLDLVMTERRENEEAPKIELHRFSAGERYNMVPDRAEATLAVYEGQVYLLQEFEEYLKEQSLEGNYFIDRGLLTITLKGTSAHGMEPDNGVNAGILLLSFLNRFKLDVNGMTFAGHARHFYQDSRGRSIRLDARDDVSGDLTVNVGVIRYSAEEAYFGLNIRYPVTVTMKDHRKAFEQFAEQQQLSIRERNHSTPHYVEESDPLVQTLLSVYEQQTGEKGKLLAIGGGTYARSLKKGVAFGALFPGREDVAHQKDEYMELDDLFRATAIYAQAIYALAVEKREGGDGNE